MKTTAVILQVAGMLFAIAFGVNIFRPYTMNDPLWMMMLFGGIAMFGIGANIEHKNTKFLSRTQFEHSVQQSRTARNLGLCGIIGVLFCIVWLIQRA